MEASSSSMQIETRLNLIQHDLDEVKEALIRLEAKQTRMQKTGTSRWESMTQELKEIHEEIFEDNMTNMKDLANISGGIADGRIREEGRDTAQGTWKDSEDRMLRQSHSQSQSNFLLSAIFFHARLVFLTLNALL